MTFGNAINPTRTYSPSISEQSYESNKDKSDANLQFRRKSAIFLNQTIEWRRTTKLTQAELQVQNFAKEKWAHLHHQLK